MGADTVRHEVGQQHMGALDLPPKKWPGLGRHTLSESWADVAQRRMQAAGIVEALDIQEEVSAGLGAGAVNPMVNPLGLQAMKEALHWCVVQTIAIAAHRRCKADRAPSATAHSRAANGHSLLPDQTATRPALASSGAAPAPSPGLPAAPPIVSTPSRSALAPLPPCRPTNPC